MHALKILLLIVYLSVRSSFGVKNDYQFNV